MKHLVCFASNGASFSLGYNVTIELSNITISVKHFLIFLPYNLLEVLLFFAHLTKTYL